MTHQNETFLTICAVNTTLIIITNIATLGVLQKAYRKDTRSCGLLLINLVLSDLVVGVIMALDLVFAHLLNGDLPNDAIMKEVHQLLKYCGVNFSLCMTAMNLNLFITIRLKIVIDPFCNLKTSKGKITKVIRLIWFLVASVLVSYYVTLKTQISHHNFLRYEKSLLTIIGIASLFLHYYCYRRLLKSLRTRHRVVKNLEKQKKSEQQVQKKGRRMRKSTWVPLSTFISFHTCWLPYILFSIVHTCGLLEGRASLFVVQDYMTLAAQMNSIINPLVCIASSYPVLKKVFVKKQKNDVNRV